MTTTTQTTSATGSSGLQVLADSAPRQVDIKLHYLKQMDEVPFFRRFPKEGELSSNIESEEFPAKITDARGHEQDYALDKNGFSFVKHQTSEENVENLRAHNDELIEKNYYPDVEALLKEKTGADRVLIFDHTIRKKTEDPEIAAKTMGGASPKIQGPVPRVHIDQTPQAGVNRVKHHLPEEADELLKGRVQIINVWRPLVNGVDDWPLAVADYRSIEQKDLVSTELRYPDRVGYTYSVYHNPNHKWHFLSKMNKDDVILIKCFDNKTDGRALLTPHTAFENPSAAKDSPPRESVEVRALVFHTQDRD